MDVKFSYTVLTWVRTVLMLYGQMFGDFLVHVAFGQQPQNLQFAGGELFQFRGGSCFMGSD